MRAESTQQLKLKLLLLTKFHGVIGYEMNKVRTEQMERAAAGRPRDSEAEVVEAVQRFVAQTQTTDRQLNEEIINVDIEYVGQNAALLIEQLAMSNQRLQTREAWMRFTNFLLVVTSFAEADVEWQVVL